jgi:uncharacterized protein
VSNVREVVSAVYESFGRGDVAAVLAGFQPDAEWRLAEGHPYAPDGQAWIGPEEIARKFFLRAGGDWEGFSIAPGRWHVAGDTVILECRYSGVYKATGKRLDAQVCHIWDVQDGKIRRFQQYIDTAHLQEVMGAGQGNSRH